MTTIRKRSEGGVAIERVAIAECAHQVVQRWEAVVGVWQWERKETPPLLLMIPVRCAVVMSQGGEGAGVGGRHQHLSDPGMYFAE